MSLPPRALQEWFANQGEAAMTNREQIVREALEAEGLSRPSLTNEYWIVSEDDLARLAARLFPDPVADLSSVGIQQTAPSVEAVGQDASSVEFIHRAPTSVDPALEGLWGQAELDDGMVDDLAGIVARVIRHYRNQREINGADFGNLTDGDAAQIAQAAITALKPFFAESAKNSRQPLTDEVREVVDELREAKGWRGQRMRGTAAVNYDSDAPFRAAALLERLTGQKGE